MSSSEVAEASADRAGQLQAFLDEHIPLTRAMQLRVVSLDETGLRLDAPLAPNVNDKGTAFGGSLASLLTLAGWGLLWSRCRKAGWACDIVIHRGEIRYRRPVNGVLRAHCPPPAAAAWQTFERELRDTGLARIALQPVVLDADGGQAVRFACQYVAFDKESS